MGFAYYSDIIIMGRVGILDREGETRETPRASMKYFLSQSRIHQPYNARVWLLVSYS